MKKVLLIEDQRMFSQMTEDLLSKSGYQVEIVSTLPLTPEDPIFQSLLARANEFYCIVWDANIFVVERKESIKTYEGYIQAFVHAGFKGPMITFSSSESCRAKQMAVGCTHDLGDKNPQGVVELIKTFQ